MVTGLESIVYLRVSLGFAYGKISVSPTLHSLAAAAEAAARPSFTIAPGEAESG